MSEDLPVRGGAMRAFAYALTFGRYGRPSVTHAAWLVSRVFCPGPLGGGEMSFEKTMTVRDLRAKLVGVDDDLPVVVRVQRDDDGEMMLGDAIDAEVDAGCTEDDVFLIDADGSDGRSTDEEP